MAGKYSLTLQLQLQSPQNVAQIVTQLQKQLGAVAVNVQVKNAAKATQQINQLTSATNNASNAAAKLGDAFGVSLKRFAAFSLASRAIGVFTRGLAGAIDSAIEFQNELVKISQITGENLNELGKLTSEITNLATTFGVASNEILSVTNILAQAGIKANDLTIAIRTLTKTKLAPTFGDIQDTAEGAVALIAQFGEGVGALERQFGAVNRVAAEFAVESEDLIEVIRRTGGVFKASGGDLEELLALFTSVRATTRESAESIATALKTIFTRIQRPETIQYLRQFGIELVDLNGKFVGPYEAVRRLSAELGSLGEGDIRFISIAEELGGYRQIGKVIPLLRQFETAERARQVAIESGNSLSEDAAKAQQSLAVQFTRTREKFLALIRGISETSSFQILVKTSLNLANALISVADALKPIIPLVATLAAVKFGANIGSFFGSVGAAFTRKQFGGPIQKFASGGMVPGSGNSDSVPAMLTPGEFVIRKSSVKKLGAGRLAAMNNNRYAEGGIVSLGGKASKTELLTSEKEKLGLQNDRYEYTQVEPELVPISLKKYRTLSGGGKGWEGWLYKNYFKGRAKWYKEAGFPVDFVYDGVLFDAKDKREPKDSIEQEQARKSLNYSLRKKFGQKYNFTGAGKNTIKNVKEKSAFLNSSITAGSDLFNLPEVTFLYPEVTYTKSGKEVSSFSKGQAERKAFQTAPAPKKKKFFGGAIQKFNLGSKVSQTTRRVGYIDSDVLADPANAGIVTPEMEKLGITSIPDYMMYLAKMAAAARKTGELGRFRVVAAMAGAGKSTLMLGGQNNPKIKDDASLRNTTRFPILRPTDISRASEVITATATVTQEKLDNFIKAADKTYVLSSSTKEERQEIKRRRGVRNTSSNMATAPAGAANTLFGRDPGTTDSAPTDSASMEAMLGANLANKKLRVLGIQENKRARIKRENEQVETLKKEIGLFYGSFSPTTVGHQSMMDAAIASGISPQDFLVLVGSNEALNTKDPHSFRTAVFDQDFRALMAQASFGARGAMISKKGNRDFGIPSSMEISAGASGRRRFVVPAVGSTAFVAGKDDKASKKYTDAGYKIQDVARDEGNVSGSIARDAILGGNMAEMQRLLSPEVFDVVQKNLGQLRNRAEVLPKIIENVRKKEVASLSEIEAKLANLPARIDKKKVAADPEYAKLAEQVVEIRKRRDKIKSSGAIKPFKLIDKLAKRYPEKYGLKRFATGGMVPGTGNRDTVPAMLTPGEFVIRKSSVAKIGAQNLAAMNSGGAVQKFEFGGEALEKLAAETRAEVAAKRDTDRFRGKAGDRISRMPLKFEADTKDLYGGAFLSPEGDVQDLAGTINSTEFLNKITKSADPKDTNLRIIKSQWEKLSISQKNDIKSYADKSLDYNIAAASLEKDFAEKIENKIYEGVLKSIQEGGSEFAKETKIAQSNFSAGTAANILRDANIDNVTGNIFQAMVENALPYDDKEKDNNSTWDFPAGLKSTKFNDNRLSKIPTDAKTRFTNYNIRSLEDKVKATEAKKVSGMIAKALEPVSKSPSLPLSPAPLQQSSRTGIDESTKAKILNAVSAGPISLKQIRNLVGNPLLAPGLLSSFLQPEKPEQTIKATSRFIKKMASGGAAPSDTVPALLTPGEFVFSKKSAQRIGYGALNRMNKNGVTGYAKGGPVAVKKFSNGTGPTGVTGGGGQDGFNLFSDKAFQASVGLSALTGMLGNTESAFGRMVNYLGTFGTAIFSVISTLNALNITNIASLGKSFEGLKGAFNKTKTFFGRGAGGAGDVIGGFRGRKGQRKKGESFTESFQATTQNIEQSKKYNAQASDRDRVANLERERKAKLLAEQQFAEEKIKAGKSAGPLSGPGMLAGTYQTRAKDLKNQIGPISNKEQKSLLDYIKKNNIKGSGIGGQNEQDISSLTSQIGGIKSQLVSKPKDLLDPKSLTGKLGNFLAKTATTGGIKGQAAGLATKGLTAIGASSAGPALATLTAAAGPIALITTGLTVLNGVVGAAIDAQGRYTKAVETGNAANAAFYGSLKEAPGLLQLLDLGLSNLVGNISPLSDTFNYLNSFIGGPTITYLKENAKAQALAAKYTEENAKSQERIQTLLNDIQSGVSTQSATDALGQTGSSSIGYSREIAMQAQQSTMTAQNAELGNRATILQDFASLGGLIGESSSAKNTRIEAEARKQNTESINRNREAFNQLFPVLTKSAQEYIIAGKGVDTFVNDMISTNKIRKLDTTSKNRLETLKAEKNQLGPGKNLSTEKSIELANLEQIDEEFKNTIKMFQQQQKAIEENRKYIESLNFGFRNINSAAQATTLGLELLTSSVETGYNAFENSAKQLEAALSNVGQSMNPEDVQNAMGTLAQTLAGYGASQDEIDRATNSFGALYTAQTEAQGALESLKTTMLQNPTGVAPEKLRENFKAELGSRLQSQGVAQPEIDRVINSLNGLDLSSTEVLNKIKSGDLGAFTEEAFAPLREALTKETLGPLQERAKQENVLISLTKQRIDLEKSAIEARKQSIDIEMESKKAIEEFGGPVVKSADKLNALNQKLNLDLGSAGVKGATLGSSTELAGIQSAIRGSFTTLQTKQNTAITAGGAGAFAGAAGVGEDKRQQLEAAQQSLIDYSRQRLDLIREEIDIAKKKNELEKSAAEKLLGGDVEGFIQSQQASAAASVLRSGDQSLAKLFSPAALGEAFKSLEGQGLSSAEMQSAAQTALSPVGGTTRMAQVLTGTTPELESLKTEGRGIANVLGEAGKGMADMQQMKVNAQQVIIEAAQVKMGEQMNVAATGSNMTGNPIAGFRRGGTVYANRGMFVPRGTDTVPAMLTPGEFVVNAKAAQQNLGLLSAINGGAQALSRGGTVYASMGGWMRSIADFIPFLGSGLDIGEGVADLFKGNFGSGAGKLGMGALGMLTDIATLGGSSIAKGLVKTGGKSLLKIGSAGAKGGLTGQFGKISQMLGNSKLGKGIYETGQNAFSGIKNKGSEILGGNGTIGTTYSLGKRGFDAGTGYLKGKFPSIAGTAMPAPGTVDALKGGVGALGSLGKTAAGAIGSQMSFGGGVRGGLTKLGLKNTIFNQSPTAGQATLDTSASMDDINAALEQMKMPTTTPQATSTAARAAIPASRPLLRAPQVAPRMATANVPQIGGGAVSPMQQSQRMLASAMSARGGGGAGGAGGISPETVSMLTSAFDKFAESVQTLQSMQISVKLDATNINVNFNGASFLSNLTEEVRRGVLTQVKNEIENQLVIGNDGRAKFQPGGMV